MRAFTDSDGVIHVIDRGVDIARSAHRDARFIRYLLNDQSFENGWRSEFGYRPSFQTVEEWLESHDDSWDMDI